MRSATRLPPETSTSGAGDVLDELQQDHRRVEALFARASLTAGATRSAVIEDIVAELTVHAAVEERAVYPAMAAAIVSGEAPTEHAAEEHAEMKALLERLQGAEPDAPDTVDDLRRLQLVTMAHVAVEEAQLFPAFRSSATPEALADLATAVKEAR